MAAISYVFVNRSRFAIGRVGTRGGFRYVALKSGRLVVRRDKDVYAFVRKGWSCEEHLCVRDAARKFLDHSGGTSNTAEIFLREVAYGHLYNQEGKENDQDLVK